MSSATGSWLESEDNADLAYLLVIDGLAMALSTRPELEELTEAWVAATGNPNFRVLGGLKPRGMVEREIKMFDPRIDPSSLTFSILDYDDILTPMMFGEGRTDIKRTRLARSIAADETVIYVDDVASIPGLVPLYMGLETLIPTAEDTGANTWTVERGYGTIFPRLVGGNFAYPQTLPVEGGERPEITDVPTTWLNRQVGFYACHRVDGAWSAGLPGTVANDAELVWAGMIKSYNELGDGWIDLDCIEITDLCKTTLGAAMYEGTLAEGMWLTAADCEIRLQVTEVSTLGNYTPFTEVVTALVDGYRTHEEAARALNAAIAARLLGSPNTYSPTDSGVHFVLSTQSRYRIFWGFPESLSTSIWEIRVSLSERMWSLLGWPTWISTNLGEQFRSGTTANGVLRTLKLESVDYKFFAATAPTGPLRFWSSSASPTAGKIRVRPNNDLPFVPQLSTYLPSGAINSTDGFLMIGDAAIVAVSYIGDGTFDITGILNPVVMTVESDPLKFRPMVKPFLNGEDVYDSTDMKVQQVWIEKMPIGLAMLRILCSTGLQGYNIPFYDTLPATLGCGFPGSLIDFRAFLQMGNIP